MYRRQDHLESPLSRRFSQVFVVALATLITSGTGLLSFVHQHEGPDWLKATVLASSVAVGTSFVGWVVSSFTDYWREESRFRQAD